MFLRLRSCLSYAASFLAGALLPLAFAPYNLWTLAFLCPLALLYLWHQAPPKKAFFIGLWFGVGFFGLGVSWVFVSIHYYGNTDIPLSIFITTLFVMILAFFIGSQGYILKRFFKGGWISFALFGFPSLWAIFEWLRSTVLGGFPWLYLGYSQLQTPLKGFAPLFGVFGVSFMTLIISGALFLLLQKCKRGQIIAVLSILTVLSTGYFLNKHSFTQVLDQKYTVTLVQGNIAPLDKFTFQNPLASVEKTYGKLTDAHWSSDLIVWPENAIPLPLPHSEPYLQTLKDKAAVHNTTLITGIQTIVNSKDYFNSLITIGQGEGIYHKRHLVPFGEFLPFEQALRGLISFFDIPMSNFVEGPEKQDLIKVKDILLAPLICYEIAYPELVRTSLQNAHAIVLLSEDGWFGNSLGPHQHLDIAKMRALESGRYVLRSTTTGISAVIKPNGELASRGPQFEACVVQGEFSPVTGQTPWMWLGCWPLLLFFTFGFILPGRIRQKLNFGFNARPIQTAHNHTQHNQ